MNKKSYFWRVHPDWSDDPIILEFETKVNVDFAISKYCKWVDERHPVVYFFYAFEYYDGMKTILIEKEIERKNKIKPTDVFKRICKFLKTKIKITDKVLKIKIK